MSNSIIDHQRDLPKCKELFLVNYIKENSKNIPLNKEVVVWVPMEEDYETIKLIQNDKSGGAIDSVISFFLFDIKMYWSSVSFNPFK